MEKKIDISFEEENEEAAEERLAMLIKEAGEDVRERNRKVTEDHFKKLRAVIAEAVASRQPYETT